MCDHKYLSMWIDIKDTLSWSQSGKYNKDRSRVLILKAHTLLELPHSIDEGTDTAAEMNYARSQTYILAELGIEFRMDPSLSYRTFL